MDMENGTCGAFLSCNDTFSDTARSWTDIPESICESLFYFVRDSFSDFHFRCKLASVRRLERFAPFPARRGDGIDNRCRRFRKAGKDKLRALDV